MKKLLLTAAALGLAAPAFAQEENTVSMDEVPEAAMTAATENAPEGITEFESVQIDDDGGTETYEFAATKEDGMGIEVDVLADGTLEEVEEEIAMEAVPQPVSATLESEASGFEPTYIEKSTRADGAIVYEFEGQLEGQEVDLEINEDGSGFVNNADMEG
jgi:uncharacterized membrane protein YkoI